ncbi:MAG: hypothetical protein EB039_11850, partial [Proteobacteria bacterium]|nr:hypothetical protein [Pseudomonadota bacterium]
GFRNPSRAHPECTPDHARRTFVPFRGRSALKLAGPHVLFTRLPILRVDLPHASVVDTLAVNKTA